MSMLIRNAAAVVVGVEGACAVEATLPACESTQKVMDTMTSAQDIVGKWDLKELMGKAVEMSGRGGDKPGFEIAKDGGISGFAGVNRFSSSLDMDKLMKGDFSMKPAAATKMAGPPEAMNIEDMFLKALTETTGFDLSGDQLTLKKGAEVLAKLVKG